MNLHELVADALRRMGADGLCNADQSCGCAIDDLAPCECQNWCYCVAGRRVTRGGPDCDREHCADADDCRGWCIQPMEVTP